MRKARQADPEKARRMEKDHRDKARKLVFDHYGHACSCPGCGSTRRLVIDHVNGDGREWRIRLFGRNDCGSRIIYLWLIRNGFPDEGLQVLCQPCNASKGRGTACRLDHAKAP
jgi:hypothetical protein